MPIRGKYKIQVSDTGGSHATRPVPPVPSSGSVGASEEERSSRKPRGLRRLLERSPFSATGQSAATTGAGGPGGGVTDPSTSPPAVMSLTEVPPPATRSPPGSTCLVDTSPPTTTAAAGATASRQTMSPPPPSASNPMEVIVEDEYSDPVDVRRRQSHEDIDADEEEATNAETRVYCEPYDSKYSHQGEQRRDRGSTVSRESEQLTPTNLVGGASSGGRLICSRSNSMESPANTGMVPIMTGRLSSAGRSSNSSDSRTLSDSPAAFVRSPPGAPPCGGGGGSSCSSPCSPGARLVSSPPSSEHQARPKPFSGAARVPPGVGIAAAPAGPGGLYSSSPQGNNVISHHPSSPFEPVAGGPALSIAAMAVPGPVPAPGPRRTSLHGPSPLTADSGPAPGPPPPPPPQTAPPPPPVLPRSDSGAGACEVGGGAGGDSEVYDEAWDVRAARLGLDLSRVQETDIDCVPPPPAGAGTTPGATAGTPGSAGGVGGAVATSPSSSSLVQAATPAGGPGPVPPAPPTGAGTVAQTVADSDDYDYAYNRAWQLSQEMNRSLSLNQAGSTDSNAAPGAVPAGGPPTALPCPLPVGGHVGPMLEAQEVLDPDCVAAASGPSGSGSASSPVKTRSAQPDTDSLSTDSYDEPWDVRHRRMLEDLTGGGSRFIDHPPSFMSASMTGPALSGAPPPPPHHPPPGTAPNAGQSSTGTAATRRRSRNHSGPMRSEPVNPNSPLEDQPWYHSDITRAEAENLLKIHWEGSYLVRRSESNRQDFSLSIKHNKGYLHMKIVRNPRGEFILGQYSQPYSSIPAMIHHYSLSLLPIKGADHMTLQHPVSKHICQQSEPLRVTTA